MEEIKFNNLEELYRKLTPALNTKVSELKRNNIHHIKEHDIWRYMRKSYWPKKEDLTLGDMVNDILSTPNIDLEEYMIEVIKTKNESKKQESVEKQNELL